MKKEFKGKAKGLTLTTKRIKSKNSDNKIFLSVPNPSGGTVEIIGTDKFVSKIFRQLLEHPESLVMQEVIASYEALSEADQKRFRKFFKVGEFANPDDVAWPAWLE